MTREAQIAKAWQELVETSDVTSPEEYPNHALITREQLADFMQRAALSTPATEPQGYVVKPLVWRKAENEAGIAGLWYSSRVGGVIKCYHGQKGEGWSYRDEWYPTLEAAQSAAQLRHEQFVSQFLASRPAPQPAADTRVRCAECDCGDGECNWIATPAPSDKIAEAARSVGAARLTLDTGASRMGETLDYEPEIIAAVLDVLDAALRALAGRGE